MLFFYPSRRLGMESRAGVYGITEGLFSAAWFHTRLRRNSIPQQVADFIHGCAVIWMRKENDMAKNLLLEYSKQLACEIAKLCNKHKMDSNTVYQVKKSSSSVFANISEAQYPQSLADMLSKFKIARKECMETESWLKLMFSSGCIDEMTYWKQIERTTLISRPASCHLDTRLNFQL